MKKVIFPTINIDLVYVSSFINDSLIRDIVVSLSIINSFFKKMVILIINIDYYNSFTNDLLLEKINFSLLIINNSFWNFLTNIITITFNYQYFLSIVIKIFISQVLGFQVIYAFITYY